MGQIKRQEQHCNQQGKGGYYARTHRHARTPPNPEALCPEIEEGVVNGRPLQALFLLPQGGAGPATALAPASYRLLLRCKGGELTPIS